MRARTQGAAQTRARVLLRTPRLTMREFTPVDFGDMLRLDSDPRVLKYINGGKPMSRADVEAAVKRVTGYYGLYPGLGVWRASRRDNGAFVGWYCLKYCPPTTEVEVGYRLLFEAWGKGYATEGARALVDYGFDRLGVTRIIGVTHPDNKASQHVLEKSGLRDSGWGRYYNRRLRLFVAESSRR
ncbi:MAG: GNAT family N-acetyltransferase [Pseudomonadota bacterium]|nr:GNAT family N-acetyltransferase [Pseudomonadota bacterium]